MDADTIPIDDLLTLLPGTYYMDPPDGGSVTVLEQLQRMAKDAEHWRNLQKVIDNAAGISNICRNKCQTIYTMVSWGELDVFFSELLSAAKMAK